MAVPQETGPAWDSLFSVNLGVAVWTLLTFLTLLVILGKYAWGPLLGALDKREKGIQGNIDDAKRQRDEAEKLLAEYREQLADGRRQAQAMVAEGREAADALRKELEAKAREETQAMLANARREITREREAAVEAVRRESVDVALAVASRLLSERLDADRDRQLAMDYIDDLSDSEGALA
ncbi:MAG: F0F1 ATP synthase subunit B [Gemmatimonadetes bacterium]|nr:F0F1 ATP synthase subunit B [Gemmatimonadota bacterium]MXX36009.1 F0F1 ATP synthase subunit B [Gemmatimonadota bacterium]MYA12101.1 F0F1 ATP synthase subunit B [Gemmatimonadota bacterium]MYD14756.1 F0F1 ATP synthase subunit B [Gemmatimonadota bacterium]MYE92810.1 F0F1 ATP synthase subunit B [Gemmatimonadota bacterium]